MTPSDSNDVGWAVRLVRDIVGMTGKDVEARRESIVLTYFDTVRSDEREVQRRALAEHGRARRLDGKP